MLNNFSYEKINFFTSFKFINLKLIKINFSVNSSAMSEMIILYLHVAIVIFVLTDAKWRKTCAPFNRSYFLAKSITKFISVRGLYFDSRLLLTLGGEGGGQSVTGWSSVLVIEDQACLTNC